MNTIIFYHRADLDGHCSGAIAKQAYPEAELHGIDYGDLFPWEQVKGARVILVDFSLQPWSAMQRLAEAADHLLWIDHHKTAIAKWEEQGFIDPGKVEVVVDPQYAACELAWKYFNPHYPTPLAVQLLGRYDVWDHRDTQVLPFQMGMRLLDTDPAEGMGLWETKIFPQHPPASWYVEITNAGQNILAYQKQCNARLMRCAFVMEFAGKVFLAVNAGGINSLAFEGVYDPALHDAVMSFFYVGSNRWKVSMYSPDQRTDCSEIAKAMGGGGHAYACGFQVEDIAVVLEGKPQRTQRARR